MNVEDRQKLKQALEQTVVSIQQEITSLQEATKPIAPDDAIGRLSRMEAIHSKSINEANLHTARTRLLKLERALSQVNNPDYGYCVVCDEPIPIKRLLLIPESTMCVQCKEKSS